MHPTRRATASWAGKRRRAGFSLIEVMIVVVIIALAAAGASYGAGALTRTKLRSACMKLVAASRWSYGHSVVTGKTTRILLDFQQGTMAIEEASARVTLASAKRRDASDESNAAAIDPWKAAEARLGDPMTAQLGRSPFGPITNPKGEPMSRYQAQKLGDGIRVLRLYVPHEAEPRQDGSGALYFFAGGMGQHAVVQLVDASDTVYSVEVQPLTGRATVHAYAFEPGNLLSDADEVRDVR